jgi:hypothetical protein
VNQDTKTQKIKLKKARRVFIYQTIRRRVAEEGNIHSMRVALFRTRYADGSRCMTPGALVHNHA